MKFLIEVEVEKVDGPRRTVAAVAEHICVEHIRLGELPGQEQGLIFIDAAVYKVVRAKHHVRSKARKS